MKNDFIKFKVSVWNRDAGMYPYLIALMNFFNSPFPTLASPA